MINWGTEIAIAFTKQCKVVCTSSENIHALLLTAFLYQVGNNISPFRHQFIQNSREDFCYCICWRNYRKSYKDIHVFNLSKCGEIHTEIQCFLHWLCKNNEWIRSWYRNMGMNWVIFFSSSFFLFELLFILVEEIKICPDVACWLLIESIFWLYVSFLMVLQMKLTGFNFSEQKKKQT